MGAAVRAFPAPATSGVDGARAENQALAALLFSYSEVLHRPLEFVGGVVHAKATRWAPVVMSRAEVKAVLGQLTGIWHRMERSSRREGRRLLFGANSWCVEARIAARIEKPVSCHTCRREEPARCLAPPGATSLPAARPDTQLPDLGDEAQHRYPCRRTVTHAAGPRCCPCTRIETSQLALFSPTP